MPNPRPAPEDATITMPMTRSLTDHLGSHSCRTATACCLGLLGLTLAATSRPTGAPALQQHQSRARAWRVFGVMHGTVATQLVTAGSQGHQLGDLRILTATPIVDASGAMVGKLDAQLPTTTIDHPGNQSTIPVGNALIRPITGGSDVYAGASCWAWTEHFLDGTRHHTFHLLPTPRR